MSREYKQFGKTFKQLVWNKTNGRCWYCGHSFSEIKYMVCEHMDNEGGNEIENIFPSCYTCNLRKGSKTLEGFREHLSSPKFTETQIEYFERNGILLPENPKIVVFYGEETYG